MKTESYLVASVSSNTNNFGLRGHRVLSRSGRLFEVAANSLNSKEAGRVIAVPVCEAGNPQWHKLGFEIPREFDRVPAPIVRKVWKGKK